VLRICGRVIVKWDSVDWLCYSEACQRAEGELGWERGGSFIKGLLIVVRQHNFVA